MTLKNGTGESGGLASNSVYKEERCLMHVEETLECRVLPNTCKQTLFLYKISGVSFFNVQLFSLYVSSVKLETFNLWGSLTVMCSNDQQLRLVVPVS